jgi:hypothetical protein
MHRVELHPYWAGTLFFIPRWTASWRLHYLMEVTVQSPPAFDPSPRPSPTRGEGVFGGGLNGYLWNQTNDDPSDGTRAPIQALRPDLAVDEIRPGQAMHLNFSTADEVLPEQLRLGINGHYLERTTDTEVDGDSLSGRHEEVFSIGPGVLWHLSPDTHLFANLYREAGARNRPEGTHFNLRLVHHF